MTEKGKVTLNGKVVGEAELNEDGETVSGTIFPEFEDEIFGHRQPLEGLSIRNVPEEQPNVLKKFLWEELALNPELWDSTHPDREKGTFDA